MEMISKFKYLEPLTLVEVNEKRKNSEMHMLKQTGSVWERSILSRERSGPETCYLRLLMIFYDRRSSVPSLASKLLCLCYARLLYSRPAKSKTVSMWKT